MFYSCCFIIRAPLKKVRLALLLLLLRPAGRLVPGLTEAPALSITLTRASSTGKSFRKLQTPWLLISFPPTPPPLPAPLPPHPPTPHSLLHLGTSIHPPPSPCSEEVVVEVVLEEEDGRWWEGWGGGYKRLREIKVK